MLSTQYVSSDRPARLAGMVALGLLVALAVSWPIARDVWTTGAFRDSDDAARMVQVRDFLAGQGWFDLHMRRLGVAGDPPMHWSRLVDLPIAALARFFSLVFDPAEAERAARLAFPALLFVALLALGAALARRLAGKKAVLPAVLLLALSGLPLGQFQPGRVDHHAPQIVLLLAAVFCLVRALTLARAAVSGALCAVCVAISLAISLENLPAIAAIGCVFAGTWIIDPARRADALRGFALGLLVAAPLLLAINKPPRAWLAPQCDAFSIVHLATLFTAALGALALAVTTPQLTTMRGRLFATTAACVAPLVVVAMNASCFVDPYGGVDPVVRSVWLDHVAEARSLRAALTLATSDTLIYLVPGCLGLAGAVIAAWRAHVDRRAGWIALIVVALAAFVGATWRVSAISNFVAVAAIGAAGALAPTRLRIPGAMLVSGFAAALAFPGAPAATPTQSCGPNDFARLAGLPPGVLLAPINDGGHALALTPHRVLAAPYHRNNRGNRFSADAFTASAPEAFAAMQASGADYLAFCPGDAPRAGAPDFAQRIDGLAPLQVFRIAR